MQLALKISCKLRSRIYKKIDIKFKNDNFITSFERWRNSLENEIIEINNLLNYSWNTQKLSARIYNYQLITL